MIGAIALGLVLAPCRVEAAAGRFSETRKSEHELRIRDFERAL
jgi:hypothetical protein